MMEPAGTNDKKEELRVETNEHAGDLVRSGAQDVAAYLATEYEIIQLVKYWSERILDNEFFFFLYGKTESSYIRGDNFGRKRIAYARTVVSQEAVDQAIEEVREMLKESLNTRRLWSFFENGSDEQWREVWAESWREIREQYCAADLKEMEELETKYPSGLIAFVLHDLSADNGRPVLVFPTSDSELVPLLEASREFEVGTDK
jgi:hypothetical protein